MDNGFTGAADNLVSELNRGKIFITRREIFRLNIREETDQV